MGRTVKMWGYTQKSKYGVRSAVFCVDRKKLEKERERSIKEGFSADAIRLTECKGDLDFKELWKEVY